MESNEIIFKIFNIITDFINGLKSLGKTYTNVKIVRKIIRGLPRSWGTKNDLHLISKGLYKNGS